MRVAIVTPVYPPYRGGIGSAAFEDARHLRTAGVDVVVFTPTPSYQEGDGGSCVTCLAPLFRYGNAAFVPSLFGKLKGVDVIHLHYPFYGGELFALLASIVWRIPLVVTYHMKTQGRGWLGFAYRVQRFFLEPFLLRRAARVLVSSRDYADSVHLRHPRLVEMPFSVDTERFAPGEDDAFRDAHGIPLHVPVVLFVGGLDAAHYFKGVDVLLNALAKLPQSCAWHALIVGDGNRRATFEKLAGDLGIAGRVTFAGSVPFDDLPRAYRAANMHVLPATDASEAFGFVTLEAGASGLPSVVSNLPGVRTLVDANVTGLLVPPRDVNALLSALRFLLENKERAAAWGKNARERVRYGYDSSLSAQRLLAVYKAVQGA